MNKRQIVDGIRGQRATQETRNRQRHMAKHTAQSAAQGTQQNTQHSTHVGEPHFLKRLTLKTRPHFLKRLILKTRQYSLKRLILKTSENTTTGAGKGWGCFLKTKSESSNHFLQPLPLLICSWLVRVHLRSCCHHGLAGRFRHSIQT